MQDNNTLNAYIIFVDIRNFSKWSDSIEAFQYLETFYQKFTKIIKKSFKDPESYIKFIGDGALIIKPYKKYTKKSLKPFFNKIYKTNTNFEKLCKNFMDEYGYNTTLKLGWALVRGPIKKIGKEYLGANINKCSRLCGLARPFGIVIDKIDFPEIPSMIPFKFYHQIRKIEGLAAEIDTWVTEEIYSQYIPREKIKECPEVHIAGACIKVEGREIKVLILKRSKDRKLYPELYEGCGGQLRYSETFTEGLKRHYKTDIGIEVEVLENYHNFYFIKEPNTSTIQGIRFLCKYISGEPASENYSEIKWVTFEKLKQIPEDRFIPGLKEEFISLIDDYIKNQSS
jgi:ADP-ribose pyrophosphatase YjhB (NUDIX family)